MRLDEINLRDPFVLVEDGRYYLYGTRGATCWGPADGFDVYVSDDLQTWSGPHECFHNDGSFWATENYWAPEVARWGDRFVMLAGFKAPGVCRCTCALISDRPLGPFTPWSSGGLTPPEWECLDGTLVVSRTGEPWLIFCHEWVQTRDGEMCAVRLSPDLKQAAGDVRVLFRASEATPWVRSVHHKRTGIDGYVTDGPFAWRMPDGTLRLLWSSFGAEGYALAVARAEDVDQPFTLEPEPLFTRDGGHGMLFRALDGRLLLTLHSPNEHLCERPQLIELSLASPGSFSRVLPKGASATPARSRPDEA